MRERYGLDHTPAIRETYFFRLRVYDLHCNRIAYVVSIRIYGLARGMKWKMI